MVSNANYYTSRDVTVVIYYWNIYITATAQWNITAAPWFCNALPPTLLNSTNQWTKEEERRRGRMCNSSKTPKPSITLLRCPLGSFKGVFVILLNVRWTSYREKRDPLISWSVSQRLFSQMPFLCSGVSQILASTRTRRPFVLKQKGFVLRNKQVSVRINFLNQLERPELF